MLTTNLPPMTRLRSLLRHLTYANVVATLALFIAIGGSSYAALSLGSGDVADNSLRSRDIRNNDLRSRDVRNQRARWAETSSVTR